MTGPATGLNVSGGLRQAIALLSLTSAELVARLAVVAAEHPALRLVPPQPPGDIPGFRRPLVDPEGLTAPPDSLIAHVLQRISAQHLPPRAQAIALALAEQLEPTGWLAAPPADVARACGVPAAEVETVLARLQGMEPGGLFARSLAECLRLQAEASGVLDAAVAAVLDRLPLLAVGDHAAIARAAALTEAEVIRAAGVIRGFDPKPGLAFAGPMPPPEPPDLQARRQDAGWTAVPHPGRTRLTVDEARGPAGGALDWQRAVARRQEIGLAVARLLVGHQAAYLDRAGPLRPIAAARIAALCGVHVATVNRVLRGITIETPAGTFPLRRLVARPVGNSGVAAQELRAALTALLAAAPPGTRSDAELAAILAARGLPVARRTVAKYRAQLPGRG